MLLHNGAYTVNILFYILYIYIYLLFNINLRLHFRKKDLILKRLVKENNNY